MKVWPLVELWLKASKNRNNILKQNKKTKGFCLIIFLQLFKSDIRSCLFPFECQKNSQIRAISI